MTAWRQAIELAMGEKDLAALGAIARSRTEPASRVERARMLLAYRDDPSFFAVAQDMGVHHQTVGKATVPLCRALLARMAGAQGTLSHS
jgi:hypothetical protein